MKREIENRSDLHLMVTTFYDKVKKDKLLSPIFNAMIGEMEWENHIDKLTNFWETVLFGVKSYKGNPGIVHKKVYEKTNFQISNKHFNRWMKYWNKTIDDLFEGELAENAKKSAHRMSVGLLSLMY